MSQNFKELKAVLIAEDYDRVKSQLYHGQLTEIVRAFIEALGEHFDSHGKSEIYRWLDGERSLTIDSPLHRRRENYESDRK